MRLRFAFTITFNRDRPERVEYREVDMPGTMTENFDMADTAGIGMRAGSISLRAPDGGAT